jgi:hypothetical protein
MPRSKAMMKNVVSRAEILNIVALMVACVAAHVFPYALLIASYAILGPAHYLTQISWLHERRYFASTRGVLPVMGVGAILLVLPFFGLCVAQPWFGACLVGVAISIAVASTVPASRALIAGMMIGTMLLWAVVWFRPVALVLAVLVPTVLHVFIFTLSFMLLGSLRSHSGLAGAAAVVMLVCAVSFWWPGVGQSSGGAGDAVKYFGSVADAMKRLGVPLSVAQVFGFLSFAYTYHFLNWFVKVEVIQWHNVSSGRVAALVCVYGGVIGCYAVSFNVGFLVSLVPSYLHVLLELPLNVRTFVSLARAVPVRGSVARPT